jgi:hypothetical protein
VRQKGFIPIFIILILIGIGILGYFGIFYKSQPRPLPEETTSPEASTSPTFSTNTTPPQSTVSKIFLVKFNLKSESNPPPIHDNPNGKYTLAEYLDVLFKLPTKSTSNVLFDTRSGSPYGTDNAVLKRPYYIILNQPTKLSSSYTDQYLSATTQVVDDAMLPYLIKNDYCEKDSDCSIRAAMCTVGAYNYYQGYHDPPWGCGPGGYKGAYSWFEYGMYDDQLNCNLDSLEFDGVKCDNHICLETGYKKVCAK